MDFCPVLSSEDVSSSTSTKSSNGGTADATAASAAAPPRPKINSACEACRQAKVKCQPSDQNGICRRCLEFKRECVFRTGPRTRRPRQSRLNSSAPRPPPPPGPSKTFSINFDMPAPDDASPAALESLARRHASYIDHLLPPEDDHHHTPMFDDLMLNAISSFHHPGGFALTPPRSYAHSHSHSHPHPHSSGHGQDPSSIFHSDAGSNPPSHSSPSNTSSSGDGLASYSSGSYTSSVISISSVGLKPQFNLDSASHLLDCFRKMLPHFPCIVLPPDATVPSLSRTRPFVLLAILSVASGAGSLQGHTLYDDEFRKILGLKFVAGGERSIELLQGLLIYSAWYPFHLRPKNKQAFQYIRMAAEIAHDLDLVHPPADTTATVSSPVTPEQIDGMRTYLSCYYLVSAFIVTWTKFSALGLEFTSWTSTCCDILERHSVVEGDATLSWLVRCGYILEETSKVDRYIPVGDQKNARFMLMGYEAQFREWRDRIPAALVSDGSALQIIMAFTEMYLYASPLLRFGRPKGPSTQREHLLEVEAERLSRCLPIMNRLFSTVTALPSASFVPFTSADWGKLIQVTILGLRLSLPLALCPAWDDKTARKSLHFATFLERFSKGDGQETRNMMPPGAPTTGLNVLGASRIVFGVVWNKYSRRLAKIEGEEEEEEERGKQKEARPAAAAGGASKAEAGSEAMNLDHEPAAKAEAATQNGASGATVAGTSCDDMTTTQECGDGDANMVIPQANRLRGCPMLDGSLEGYFPAWDPDLTAPPMSSELLDWDVPDPPAVGGSETPAAIMAGSWPDMEIGKAMYHDMWATMNPGWPQDAVAETMDPRGMEGN